MKQKEFERELAEWMADILSPYCLNECKISCCSGEGTVQIDKGYEYLFEVDKINDKKIPIGKYGDKGPHLFKSKRNGLFYFEGEKCPNYDSENKKCLIHNQYPRCALYPLVKTGKPHEGYTLFSICSLHKMKDNQEPLKSLIALCKRHGFKLFKEQIH